MNVFLEELSKQYPNDRIIYVVMERHGINPKLFSYLKIYN